MSVARGFGLNGTKYYTNIAKPTHVNFTFTVNAANSAGLGVTSVKSNGYVEHVFMHTSATPGSVAGFLNPNPPVGYAFIRFKNNFNIYLNNDITQNPPLVSTATTSVTANGVYAITSLGTATLAQWQAKGLQPGLTPTVGQAFVATATGTIGGGATVGLPGQLTASNAVVVGDPNQSLANLNIASNAGAIVIVQFSGPTSAGVTTMIPTNPADGTMISMRFSFDASTVTIDGL